MSGSARGRNGSDGPGTAGERDLEACVRSAAGRAGAGEVAMPARGPFHVLRPSPDLRAVPFLPFRVQPGRADWSAVTLVPSCPLSGKGRIGIEIVNPAGSIVCQQMVPLEPCRSREPVTIEFAPLAESGSGTFELRAFVREADSPIAVLEYAWPVPLPRRAFLRPRLLCGLAFGVRIRVAQPLAPPSAITAAPGVLAQIEHPTDAVCEIRRGVLSVRGWAWSEGHGEGELLLRIREEGAAPETALMRRASHRICRPDLPRYWPQIPPTNRAGFEVSVDRFELPPCGQAEVVFRAGERDILLAVFATTAWHDDRLAAPDAVACEGCGADDMRALATKDGLRVVECQQCHLAFTNPRPDWARIAQRYSPEYFNAEYLPSIETLLDAHRARWRYYLDQIERFRAVHPALLEVGAGAGHLLREAVARGWTARGIELNPLGVAHARDALGVDVDQGNVEDPAFQLPEEAFGAIMLDSVLEHLRFPRRVIAKCARALRPGGGLFIWTIANDGDVMIREGAAFTYFGPSEHLFYFSTTSLCRLCEDAGLRVDDLGRDATGDSLFLVASKRLDAGGAPTAAR